MIAVIKFIVTPATKINILFVLDLLHINLSLGRFSSSSPSSPAIAQNPPIGKALNVYSVGSFFLLNVRILGPIPKANS